MPRHSNTDRSGTDRSNKDRSGTDRSGTDRSGTDRSYQAAGRCCNPKRLDNAPYFSDNASSPITDTFELLNCQSELSIAEG